MKRTLLLLTTALTLNGFAQITTNGLVAYYPFSGNARDSSGNGNNGTVYGATLTTDRLGIPNRAYSFDVASANYIELPTAKLLNNRYTYSAWAKLKSLPQTGGTAFVFNIGANIGDQSVNITNKYLGYNGIGGGGYNTVAPNYALQQYSTPDTGRWYHIATVRDSNSAKLYLNGMLIDSVSSTSNKVPQYGSTPKARIGKRYDGTGPFNGVIDDVRIYDRALTPAEILTLSKEGLLGVGDFYPETRVLVYPNPARDLIMVDLGGYPSGGINFMKIVNTLGQVVYTAEIVKAITQIDGLSQIGKGIFFLQILDSAGNSIAIKKIVIQ